FGRHMIDQKYGRIINIGSLASFVGLYEVAAYTASKAGVAGLTRSLALEWAKFNVCVNMIAPGVFRTELNATLLDGTERGREFLLRTPMKRFGHLDELVGAAVFFGVGRSQLCDWSIDSRRWRLLGQRRESIDGYASSLKMRSIRTHFSPGRACGSGC